MKPNFRNLPSLVNFRQQSVSVPKAANSFRKRSSFIWETRKDSRKANQQCNERCFAPKAKHLLPEGFPRAAGTILYCGNTDKKTHSSATELLNLLHEFTTRPDLSGMPPKAKGGTQFLGSPALTCHSQAPVRLQAWRYPHGGRRGRQSSTERACAEHLANEEGGQRPQQAPLPTLGGCQLPSLGAPTSPRPTLCLFLHPRASP